MTTINPALGFGMSVTFCTVILPYPNGQLAPVLRAVTALQPTLGFATDPVTGATLPSTSAGRRHLSEALICRPATTRGALIDTKIPSTTRNYGIDILDPIGGDMTAEEIGQLSAGIDGQMRQDERVKSSSTAATLAGSVLVMPITVTDGTGPFRMVLAIDTLNANFSLLSAPQ